MENIKKKNEQFKIIKRQLKERGTKHTLTQLDLVLKESDINRKAFVFLLDVFDTEREISKELFEDFIDSTYDFNEELIEFLKDEQSKGHQLNIFQYFDTKNLKAIIIMAVSLGIVLGVAANPAIISGIVKSMTVEKK